MSPNNQNLSYNQQQQIHRTGGLQRLTADLAGLQFNDAEALFKNYAHRAPSGGHRAAAAAVAAAALTQTTRSPTATSSAGSRGRHLLALQQQQMRKQASHESKKTTSGSLVQQQLAAAAGGGGGGYEEQMVVSTTGTNASFDYDPQKDAQETADDAAIVSKRYKILQLVGTGNYARVYKSVTQGGKEVAVKSINLTRTSDNYKQKFLPRELNILKKISHTNICKTHEILHIADRVFIVMQFCTNGTIADLLHRIGPFSEPLARYLFTPVLDAVIYMHSLDYAHRDLKVENILLDGEYNPKLTDFSYSINTQPPAAVAAALDGQQQKHNTPGRSSYPKIINLKHVGHQSANKIRSLVRLNETFCGTLPYLSPEMIRQHPYDAKKTDVWSLGICLYVMLNDRLPFPFNDIRHMIKKQLSKDFKFKANLEFSDQIKDLMSQILEPDFARRPHCHELSKHPWFNGPRERPV